MKFYEKSSLIIVLVGLLLIITGLHLPGLSVLFLLLLLNLTITFLVFGIKALKKDIVLGLIKFSVAFASFSFFLVFKDIAGNILSRLLVVPIIISLLYLLYLILRKQSVLPKILIVSVFLLTTITSILNFGSVRNDIVRAIQKKVYSSQISTSYNLKMWDFGLKSKKYFREDNCLLGSQMADSSEIYLMKWQKIKDTIPFSLKQSNNLVYDYIYNNNHCLGQTKFAEKKYSLALKYFKKAEKAIAVRIENKNWRGSTSLLYSDIAKVYSEIDSFNLADNYFGKALSVFKKFRDSTSIYKSDVHYEIGKFLNDYGYTDNTIYHFRESLKILKLSNNSKEFKDEFINTTNRLSLVLLSSNFSPEVINISNELLTNNSLKTSHNFNYCLFFYFKSVANYNLNAFQVSKDNILEAEQCLKEEIYSNDLAIQIAFNIHKSKIFRQLNEFEMSKKTISKALEIIEINFPEKVNYKYKALVEYANLKKDLGFINEAKNLYFKAFSLSEYSDLIDIVEIPNTLCEVAKIEIELENYSKGLNYYNKAKEVSNDYLDMESNFNSFLINDFAYIEYNFNNLVKADSLYKKVLKLNDVNPYKSIVSNSLNGIALVEMKKRNFIKTDSLFSNSLKLSKEIYPNGSQNTSTVLLNKSESLIQQKKYNEAKVLLNEAKQILDKIFKGKHLDYGKLYMLSGDIYFRTNNKSEALINYKKALSIYKKVYPKTHTVIQYLSNKI